MIIENDYILSEKLKQAVVRMLDSFYRRCSPSLSIKISHGWICTGQDEILETVGNRSLVNIIGALGFADVGATIAHGYECMSTERIVCFF
ncbi:hypothetical protein EQ875_01523 [Photobacterium damselae subsp. damselae]|nr:hypothetical protein EQ875_01523 [Photobacterium damselae subsp. damselae]